MWRGGKRGNDTRSKCGTRRGAEGAKVKVCVLHKILFEKLVVLPADWSYAKARWSHLIKNHLFDDDDQADVYALLKTWRELQNKGGEKDAFLQRRAESRLTDVNLFDLWRC